MICRLASQLQGEIVAESSEEKSLWSEWKYECYDNQCSELISKIENTYLTISPIHLYSYN